MASKKHTEQPQLIGRWIGYKVTFSVAIILLSLYLLIFLLSDHPSVDNRAVGLLAFSPFLIIGVVLLGIRKRLYLSGKAFVVSLSFLSKTLRVWRYPLSGFTKIEIVVTGVTCFGGGFSDAPSGTTEIYYIQLGCPGKTGFRINMFNPLPTGRRSKDLNDLIDFAKNISAMTGLPVEYDVLVRKDMKKWALA